VFVTHDQEEALEVADRVVVMNKGRIEQIGTPTEIYDNPATPFVYRFLGNVNAIPCELRAGKPRIDGLDLTCEEPDGHSGAGVVFIRPHDVALDAPRSGGVQAVVRHVAALGAGIRVEVVLAGGTVLDVETTREERDRLSLRPGGAVSVAARAARVFVE